MIGEGESYTNADGEEAQVYDAQVYLLLAGRQSSEEAGNTLNQWKEMAAQQYVLGQTAEESHNGQDFTVITYSFDSETNPYTRGASSARVYIKCI